MAEYQLLHDAAPVGIAPRQLAELLDVVSELLPFVWGRVGTYDEQEGEPEAAARARRVLESYRPAVRRISRTAPATRTDKA
jgi:hypothetical protein